MKQKGWGEESEHKMGLQKVALTENPIAVRVSLPDTLPDKQWGIFFFQNCSDLLWVFLNTRTIFSNSERSEQFLKQNGYNWFMTTELQI